MYGSKTEFSLYILFTELYMARVWRCRVTYDQHPRTSYSTEFPPGTQFPAWANHNTVAARLLWVGLVLPANHYVVASPA